MVIGSVWYGPLFGKPWMKMMGMPSAPIVEPAKGDYRFKDADWQSNFLFDYLKQSYLITSRWLVDTMSTVAGLDRDTARKVDFYTRQFADAFSPSNFVWTNPEVLRATFETQGRNLLKGLGNFLLTEFPDEDGRRAADFIDFAMREEGIWLRPVGEPGFANHSRIGLGTRAENELVVRTLDRFLNR